MADIIQFNGMTTHDIDAVSMLQSISEEEPANVFVVVWPKDGSPPTYHSSSADVPVVLMRIQQFIHKYYNRDFI